MLRRNVRLLAGIRLDVVQLPLLFRSVVDQTVTGASDAAPGIVRSGGLALLPPADMGKEMAIRPSGAVVVQQRCQAAAVDLQTIRYRCACQFRKGRKDIDMRGEPVDIPWL